MTYKKWLIGFCIFVLIVLLAFFFSWLLYFRHVRITYDAYVEGNQVIVTALEKGIITNISTDETYYVQKGDVVIQTDNTLQKIRLDKAKNILAEKVRFVCSMYHEMFALESEIATWSAILLRSLQDLEHRKKVIDIGGVSLEDLEHAKAAVQEAENQLQSTKSRFEKQKSLLLHTSIFTHPLVERAKQRLKNAYVTLYRTTLKAPVSGLVAQRKAQVGMRVEKGDPLLNIIPLDQIWVHANFKETQMKPVKIGQNVTLYSDLYGKSVPYQGTIVGIPGGAGNAFSLLPPQNLSGNWIKIVQRLPVRVAIRETEALRKYPLRLGLTMKAIVHLNDEEGPYILEDEKEAPRYSTSILTEEEEGSEQMIRHIFDNNLDSSLTPYAYRAYEPNTYSS